MLDRVVGDGVEDSGSSSEPPALDPASVSTEDELRFAVLALLGDSYDRAVERRTGLAKTTVNDVRNERRRLTAKTLTLIVEAYDPQRRDVWLAAWQRVRSRSTPGERASIPDPEVRLESRPDRTSMDGAGAAAAIAEPPTELAVTGAWAANPSNAPTFASRRDSNEIPSTYARKFGAMVAGFIGGTIATSVISLLGRAILWVAIVVIFVAMSAWGLGKVLRKVYQKSSPLYPFSVSLGRSRAVAARQSFPVEARRSRLALFAQAVGGIFDFGGTTRLRHQRVPSFGETLTETLLRHNVYVRSGTGENE
jgi:hypothetical protein